MFLLDENKELLWKLFGDGRRNSNPAYRICESRRCVAPVVFGGGAVEPHRISTADWANVKAELACSFIASLSRDWKVAHSSPAVGLEWGSSTLSADIGSLSLTTNPTQATEACVGHPPRLMVVIRAHPWRGYRPNICFQPRCEQMILLKT